MHSLKPALLASLLTDLRTTGRKLVALRVAFPLIDVERVAASRPELLQRDVQDMVGDVESFKSALGIGFSVAAPSSDSSDDARAFYAMLNEHPVFFEWNRVKDMIAELRRLFGASVSSPADLRAVILRDPEVLLRCEPSSWLGPSQVFDWERGSAQD